MSFRGIINLNVEGDFSVGLIFILLSAFGVRSSIVWIIFFLNNSSLRLDQIVVSPRWESSNTSLVGSDNVVLGTVNKLLRRENLCVLTIVDGEVGLVLSDNSEGPA